MSSSTNLTDTLFDQTKFQNDVSCLREKLKECKTMRDEKLKTLKVKNIMYNIIVIVYTIFQPYHTT